MRALSTTLLLITLLPTANALDPVCVAEPDACVVVYSRDATCANAARAVWVESDVIIASAANWCYGEGTASNGDGIGIEVIRPDGSSSLQVQWYGHEQDGVPFCEMRLAWGGLAPVPGFANSATCVAGRPGLLLPALP